MVTQQRWAKYETWTVNGLTTERFEDNINGYGPVSVEQWYVGNSIQYGIRAWFRSSGGSETEITSGSPVAVVTKNSSNPYSETGYWTCPRKYFNAADALVIRWYSKPQGSSWGLLKTFITEQLTSNAQNTLESSQWAVYHLVQYYDAEPYIGYFWYGDDGSDISNIQWFEEHRVDLPDTGTGIETQAYSALLKDTVTDSGTVSSETFLGPMWIMDQAIGAEFPWHVKDLLQIGAAPLPHVKKIKIRDDSVRVTTPLLDSLPRRKVVGRRGRKIDISGFGTWAEVEALRALRDGSRRVMYLPSGETLAVLVIDVEPRCSVRKPSRREYNLRIQETS